MKKVFLLVCAVACIGANAQLTSTGVKSQIDSQVTNSTGAASITKVKVGTNMKNIVDLVTQIATTIETNVSTKAPLASPALTGTPTVPTAAAGTNTTQAASTAFVTTAANTKAPLASPALTGVPTAPTAAAGTNTMQIATTAFANGLARPYKVYTAYMMQDGTNNPEPIIMENTIGNIVWTRTSTGLYAATLNGAFTFNKTVVFVQPNGINSKIMASASTNAVNVFTYNTSNYTSTPAADELGYSLIEIRVYN